MYLSEKWKSLSSLFTNLKNKSTIFEDINTSITKLEVNLQSVQEQLDQDFSTLSNKIEFTRDQIRMSKDDNAAVEKKIDQTRGEIGQIHENLMRIKDDIINQVSSIDESIRNDLTNIRINLNSLNEKHQTNNMRILNHAEQIDINHRLSEDSKAEIDKLIIETKELKHVKQEKSIYEKEMQRCKSEIQKCLYSIQDLHRSLQATDNYLEKYQPIKLQNFITETISNVIENKKVLGRLLKYDIELYKILHQRIIDDEGVPTLDKKEYEIPDMDTIRRKIAIIEDMNINDDSEELPSDYSTKKLQKKRKRKRDTSENDSQSNISKASISKKSRKSKIKIRTKDDAIIELEKTGRASKHSETSKNINESEREEADSKLSKTKHIQSETSHYKEDQLTPESMVKDNVSISKTRSSIKSATSKKSKQKTRKHSEINDIDKIEEVDDEHKNLDTIDADKPEKDASHKRIKTVAENYPSELQSNQSKSKKMRNMTQDDEAKDAYKTTESKNQGNNIELNKYEDRSSPATLTIIKTKSNNKSSSKSKSRKSKQTVEDAKKQEVEVKIKIDPEPEANASSKGGSTNSEISAHPKHLTQTQRKSITNNQVENIVKTARDTPKNITLNKDRSRSMIEPLSTTKKVEESKTKESYKPVHHQNDMDVDSDRTPQSYHENKYEERKTKIIHDVEMSDHKESERIISSHHTNEHSKSGHSEKDPNDEMELEGGEEEQSESSEDSYSEKSHSEGESEEEEESNHPRSPVYQEKRVITLKDIDKEFWRILHSYRPEINQLQLDHNSIRDSISENCKIVKTDAEDLVKMLEKKMDIEFKEQMMYVKTLQSDIES